MTRAITGCRQILERGLLRGWWSIQQFNTPTPFQLGPELDFTLPTTQFLDDHPEFRDPTFRDLDAYRSFERECLSPFD